MIEKEKLFHVVVDERGVQRVATPNYDVIPNIISTVVSQSADEASNGVADVRVDALVNISGSHSFDGVCRVVSDREIEVNGVVWGVRLGVVEEISDDNGGFIARATIWLDAVLDQTIKN